MISPFNSTPAKAPGVMLELELTTDDPDAKPVVLALRMRLVLQWEKQFGRSLGQLDSDTTKLSYLYELAYTAAIRQAGSIPAGMTFDQFCETYDVAPVGEDDAGDPTHAGA
jgi:hypothetical protein